MPPQPTSRLERLVQRDRCKDPALNTSVAPTTDSSIDNPDHPSDDADKPEAVQTEEDSLYDGLDWTRVPQLERRGKEHLKGPPSWIYRNGWPVYNRFKKPNYWLCRYCHVNKHSGGIFDSQSTSSAATHLARRVKGHGIGSSGPISTCPDPNQGTLVAMMRQNNVEVSQSVANEMSASFSKRKFHDALIDWVASDNQSLRVIETPSFRSMIKAANLLAESVLWRNHQSLRDTIVAEYHAFIPVVTAYLRSARSLIHVSFDNWTSTGGKLGLTGICVHMMDTHSIVQDFALGLPELHGQHSGVNIADVVATTLTNFGVDKDSVGYFVLDNAYNNDTAVASLADLYGFETPERRLRCCCHILNFSAQVIIWGKDRNAYENEGGNLEVGPLDPPYKQYINSTAGLLLLHPTNTVL
jgi:hypothetical protein